MKESKLGEMDGRALKREPIGDYHAEGVFGWRRFDGSGRRDIEITCSGKCGIDIIAIISESSDETQRLWEAANAEFICEALNFYLLCGSPSRGIPDTNNEKTTQFSDGGPKVCCNTHGEVRLKFVAANNAGYAYYKACPKCIEEAKDEVFNAARQYPPGSPCRNCGATLPSLSLANKISRVVLIAIRNPQRRHWQERWFCDDACAVAYLTKQWEKKNED